MSEQQRQSYAQIVQLLKTTRALPTTGQQEDQAAGLLADLILMVLLDVNRIADSVERIANELSVRPPR